MSLEGKVLPSSFDTRDYFETLMKDESLKLILDFIRRRKNLRIEFKENKRNANSLIDRGESIEEYNNCYLQNKIIVDVIKIVDDNDEILTENRSLIIQKLFIYCNHIIFDNNGKPYAKNGEIENEDDFLAIVKEAENFKNINTKIQEEAKIVLSDFKENEIHAELIARVPYIRSLFINDENIFEMNRTSFRSLFKYFKDPCTNKIEMRLKDKKIWKKNQTIKGLLMTLLLFCIGFGIYYYFFTIPNFKWKNLSVSEIDNIFNLDVDYFTVDHKLKDLIARDCPSLHNLTKYQIADALNGETVTFSGALTHDLKNCIKINYETMKDGLKVKLKNSNVNFQGKTVKFQTIADENIFKSLNSEIIKNALEEKLKIGKNLNSKNNFSTVRFFYERKSPNITKSNDKIINEVEKSKIFLLADEIGAGKSSTMKKFAVDLNHEMNHDYFNKWIEYIELSKFKKISNLSKFGEKILKLENLELKVFDYLLKSDKVVLLWDFGETSNSNFLDFVVKIQKSTKNIQLVAIDYENSRKFEEKLNVIAHKFVKMANNEVTRFGVTSTSLMDILLSNKLNLYESYENFMMKKIENSQKVHPKFLENNFTLEMKEIIQKFAIREVFDDENNSLKIEIKNLHKNYIFEGISKTEILSIKDEENFEFFHSSAAEFFTIQYLKEKLLDENEELDDDQEKRIKMLFHLSKFHDSKLIENFVETLPTENVKNIQTINLMRGKYSKILSNFSDAENPSILLNFFKNDLDISEVIGSSNLWLEENFKIEIKDNFLTDEKIDLWQKYEENLQKGKILYQIWNHRGNQSANAILTLTKIQIDEDFFLDLKSMKSFRKFFDFAVKELTSNETKEIFFNYAKEIFETQIESLKDFDKICGTFTKNVVNEEIYKNMEIVFYKKCLRDHVEERKTNKVEINSDTSTSTDLSSGDTPEDMLDIRNGEK